MYEQLHFTNFNICLEAPGTLPDLPGWILGHPIDFLRLQLAMRPHSKLARARDMSRMLRKTYE